MDADTKIYHVDKHKQLIPLNNDMVNFSCFFEVTSKDKLPFKLGIAEQGSMDNLKEYKNVDSGYINGQIESDGQLKSYFLVLKAASPCECAVKISLTPQHSSSSHSPSHSPSHPPSHQILESSPVATWKYVLGVVAVAMLVYLLYKNKDRLFGRPVGMEASSASF